MAKPRWLPGALTWLNLGQGISLVLAVTAGLYSVASFYSAHIDLQNVRESAHDMIDALSDDILLASQLTTMQGQPSLFWPGATAPGLTHQGIEKARQHLHNATENWTQRDYVTMRDETMRGYRALGYEVPLALANKDLLQGEVRCLRFGDPVPNPLDPESSLRCFIEIPVQAWRLGGIAIAFGLTSAALAAFSPPGAVLGSRRPAKGN